MTPPSTPKRPAASVVPNAPKKAKPTPISQEELNKAIEKGVVRSLF